MPLEHNAPSLYEMLSGSFSSGLSLHQVNEQNQVILSVLDNMQRILNCRAGTLSHLPDYGLPDMTQILQGMPGTAHQLLQTFSDVLLKYEPRLKKITVILLDQKAPGELRYAAVRLIHAPLVSLGAHQWFTDTTNAYRAYSREYLTHPDVRPLRDVFGGYELLAYLSIRATQLGLKACEVPVTRAYPATGKTPTKISGFKGNSDLMKVLLNALAGKYNP